MASGVTLPPLIAKFIPVKRHFSENRQYFDRQIFTQSAESTYYSFTLLFYVTRDIATDHCKRL